MDESGEGDDTQNVCLGHREASRHDCATIFKRLGCCRDRATVSLSVTLERLVKVTLRLTTIACKFVVSV